MFATGIECSAPTIANGRIQRDLLEECGHYDRWQEDLALVKGMGIPFLRYGLPKPNFPTLAKKDKAGQCIKPRPL